MKFLLDHDVPEDLSYLLRELGHEILLLRDVLPRETADPLVRRFAHDHDCVMVTCNRDDFIELGQRQPHHGIVILIRRSTRAAERAALLLLLERAGEAGLQGQHQLCLSAPSTEAFARQSNNELDRKFYRSHATGPGTARRSVGC